METMVKKHRNLYIRDWVFEPMDRTERVESQNRETKVIGENTKQVLQKLKDIQGGILLIDIPVQIDIPGSTVPTHLIDSQGSMDHQVQGATDHTGNTLHFVTNGPDHNCCSYHQNISKVGGHTILHQAAENMYMLPANVELMIEPGRRDDQVDRH